MLFVSSLLMSVGAALTVLTVSQSLDPKSLQRFRLGLELIGLGLTGTMIVGMVFGLQ